MQKIRKRIFLIYNLTFLIIISSTLKAQQNYLKHFTVDDGLPSNEIYQILQDKENNLLIATDRGAIKYDGYLFENIGFENGAVSNPIYYIYKSPNDHIYFSGLKGYIYQYAKDKLVGYAHNQKISSFFQHSGLFIANTLSEQGDSLWISYNNVYNYLFKIGSCLVLPNGEVKKLFKPDGIYFDLPHKFYY
ncbi:MAG TPA: two-component regulator propeller domain-containing protein, partial [Ferruginibacter sp.]|nr:two-component regulator propeller domain-containing protein [Ferruginibacter sp.]